MVLLSLCVPKHTTGNLGGSIGAGADIPSLFLPANTPVMSMENAQGKIETVSSKSNGW
jgi:C-terminal processing protease CtpA/Prc